MKVVVSPPNATEKKFFYSAGATSLDDARLFKGPVARRFPADWRRIAGIRSVLWRPFRTAYVELPARDVTVAALLVLELSLAELVGGFERVGANAVGLGFDVFERAHRVEVVSAGQELGMAAGGEVQGVSFPIGDRIDGPADRELVVVALRGIGAVNGKVGGGTDFVGVVAAEVGEGFNVLDRGSEFLPGRLVGGADLADAV